MPKTTVRSGQVRNIDLLVEDLKDYGVEDNGGLNITVNAGRIRNNNIITDTADQALALTDNATNFIEINSSGTASANTSAFTAGRIALAEVVTASADISTITDKRSWNAVDTSAAGTTPGDMSETTKELWIALARTNIKEDTTSARAANEVGDMRVDVFTDDTGIEDALSSGFTHRTSPDFDVIATAAGISLFRPGDLTTNLQGYWKLGEAEGADATDSSTNGNDVTAQASVGSGADPVTEDYWNTSESSSDFENTNADFFNITDASQTGLDMTTVYTIVAWVKQESTVTKYLMGKAHTTTGYAFGIDNLNRMFIVNANTAFGIGSGSTLSLGKWYHLAVVFDGTANTATFYINGNVDKVIGSVTTDSSDNSGNFELGRSITGSSWDGLLKDTAIWDMALTPSQIKSLALGLDIDTLTFRPDDSSLTSPTAYWKLNEISPGSGAVSRVDSSGNSHTLTDVGSIGSRPGYFEGVAPNFVISPDSLQASDSSDFDFSGGVFTIAGWIKYDSLVAWEWMGQRTDANNSLTLTFSTTTGKLRLNVLTGGVNTLQMDSDFATKPNTWYHFALVEDGDSWTWYIDGVDEGDTVTLGAKTARTLNYTGTFNIGSNSGGTSSIDGALSDIAVWKGTALTSAEIASLASGLPLQQQGIISYYKCDESSGNLVDVIGSNTLTENGTGGVGTASGQVGTARDFESGDSDFFNITDASQVGLDSSHAVFMMAWVKQESVTGESQMRLIDKSGSTQYLMHLRTSDSAIITTVGNISHVSSDALSVSTFTHLVGQYTGAAIEAYFNGVASGSTPSTTDPTPNGVDFNIGSSGTSFFWDGLIDEVLVAHRYFREEEIKTAYNKGNNGKEVTSSEVTLASGTATVISESFALSQTPDTAMIVANKTLNTGSITLYISRVSAPGSTLTDVTKWTPVTEETLTSLSAQDSGSTGRWGATITGDAELDDIAAVFGEA